MAEKLVDIDAHINKRVHRCPYIWKDGSGAWQTCKYLEKFHPDEVHRAKGNKSAVRVGSEHLVDGGWVAEGMIA